jgi:hypothetical protein
MRVSDPADGVVVPTIDERDSILRKQYTSPHGVCWHVTSELLPCQPSELGTDRHLCELCDTIRGSCLVSRCYKSFTGRLELLGERDRTSIFQPIAQRWAITALQKEDNKRKIRERRKWNNKSGWDKGGKEKREREARKKWILKKYGGKVWTGSNWLRTGAGVGLLWTKQWTFRLHKRRGISWLAQWLLAFQVLCCMK